MDKLDPWQLLRYVLIAGGSIVTARNTNISDADVQAIAGAVVALGAAVWGVYTKWNTAAVPTMVASDADIPVKKSATGVIKTGPGV